MPTKEAKRYVTRRDVERIRRLICERFGVETDDPYGPKLVERWDWLDSGPTRWALVWEGGPYDWPSLLDLWDDLPRHVFVEAVTSWSVGVYPA